MTIEWIKVNDENKNWEKVVDIQTKDDLKLLQSKIEDAKIEDINKLTLSDTKWVSPEGVMKALTNLKKINISLWEEISLLIKKWDILWIQLALGMVVGATNSNKNADGLFGRSTLNNLWAWKVVKTNLTPTSEIEEDGEIVQLEPNMIIIKNMDDVRKWWWTWDAVFVYTSPGFRQFFSSDWRFIQKIDATEPQSILQQAVEWANYTVNVIKGNWAYNEKGQMVVTYDGKVEKNKRTEDAPKATEKFNEAIEKMKK